MTKKLNPTIAAYIKESNAHNFNSIEALFTPDAVVEDEGQTHRGLDDIRGWITKTHKEYQFSLVALDFTEEDGKTIVLCEVSGNFPGSPVQLPFRFTLDGDNIAALSIG
jgi:hypothetical protein